eukprot:1460126-Pyramimonas_sp.AAC.1
MPTWGGDAHVVPATGVFSGAPYGGHETCEGVPNWGGETRVDPATGAVGGAPCGNTKHVRGVQSEGGGGMRTQPLRPSVELRMMP